MKINIENLKARMQGRNLTIYQKADALIEFNKLLDYVEELEQLTIPAVVGRSEQLSPVHKLKKVGDFDNNHNDSFRDIG